MTYTELVPLIQQYLENSETSFVANLPLLVRTAESSIYNKVRTMDQRKTIAAVVSTGTILPPEDFIEPIYLTVDGNMLMQRQKSFLRTAYGDATGTPESYALDYSTLYDGVSTILIAPTPAAEVAYELSYAGVPYSIVEQEVTYLSVNFPECLLYACLLEGCIYMKEPGGEGSLMEKVQTRFNEAIADLQRSAEGLQLKDEYRNAPERVGAVS